MEAHTHTANAERLPGCTHEPPCGSHQHVANAEGRPSRSIDEDAETWALGLGPCLICDETSPTGRAREIGTEHGRNAGTWVEVDEQTAQAIDQTGDALDIVGVLDAPGPLSGEWADGYSFRQLQEDSGLDPEALLEDELATAYEEAYWSAFEAEVERKVEALRGPTLDIDSSRAYQVAGFSNGIAFAYDGQTFGGRARVHMIGDDREHIVDAEDLTALAEGTFCPECGQTPSCYGTEV